MTIQQNKSMSLLLNKTKKIKNKNYVRYGFSMTKKENNKEEEKIFAKHQANVINTLG